MTETKALPEPSDATSDHTAALRGQIQQLTEQLDGENWETVRAELLKTVDNMPDIA